MFEIEVISEEGMDHDQELWTCKNCGWTILLNSVGGDVAGCPECENRDAEQEYAWDVAIEKLGKNASSKELEAFVEGMLYVCAQERKVRGHNL